MSIVIPERYRPAVQKLASLTAEEASQLLEAVQKEAGQLYPQKLVDQVAQKLPTLDKGTVEEILPALVSLSYTRFATGLSSEKLAAAVSTSDDLEVPEPDRTRVQHLIRQLLDSDAIAITGKAVTVLTAHQRTFSSARVITDIRPVFKNGADRPLAAVIVHQLNITYQEGSQRSNYFVALDTRDVAKLQQVLSRASAKADTLRALILDSGLTYLEVPDEE
jgi:hypothetical protein